MRHSSSRLFAKNHFWNRHILFAVVCCGSFFVSESNSLADELPKINFDVPSLVACREVTTDDFARTHSLEKLLEVRLKTSSLLETGSDRLIRELFFFIYSPEQSLRIVDCTPKTTLLTEYAGPIDVSLNRENSQNAGFTFSPQLEMAGKANFNANLSDRKGETTRTTKLPPMQLAVASGTQKRETAAYFKFKPSTQATLEGSQEITLIIQVPIAWRADLLHVHCSGTTGVSGGTKARSSRTDFAVPIFAAEDVPAQIICDSFVRSDRHVREILKRSDFSMPSPKPDLASKFSLFVKKEILRKKDKRIQSDAWKGHLLFGSRPVNELKRKYKLSIDQESMVAFQEHRKIRKAMVGLNN